MVYIDFHSHTRCSDGSDTPLELILKMKQSGVDAFAITDHDTMQGYFTIRDFAKQEGLMLVPGVEISTKNYHILGLHVDPDYVPFQDFLKYSRSLQKKVCAMRIHKLQERGIPITYDKVERMFPDARLGKQNIFITMLYDEACRDYVREYFPLVQEHELWSLFFGKKDGVAHMVTKEGVEDEEAIEQIHRAGGIAVVAHPFKDAKNPLELERLFATRLDGLEIQPNYGERNIPYVAYAKEKGYLVTY